MSLSLDYYFKELNAFAFGKAWFAGITSPADILVQAEKYLQETIVAKNVQECHATFKGAPPHLEGNYYIGKGTVIAPDVVICGPVYIGENVTIQSGALIRPGTILSDKTSVGHGSEVKASVLFSGAKVASLAFVGNSVLGKSARIGSGVITANRKFDQSDAGVTMNGQKEALGTDFFGAIIGDQTRLGANSVTQPGTHIGPNVWVFPLTCVRDFIGANQRVYAKQELVFVENKSVKLKP